MLLTTTIKLERIAIMTSPALPAEIWGQILNYVDDFRLWTICRQISRVCRSEAEGLFYRNRIKSLQMTWKIINPQVLPDPPDIGPLLIPILRSSEFERFSENGERAHFTTTFGTTDWQVFAGPVTPAPIEEIPFGKGPFGKDNVIRRFRKVIGMSDLDFKKLLWLRGAQKCQTTLGYYTNDTDIPGLQFSDDLEKVSFLWKELLDLFYMEQVFLLHMQLDVVAQEPYHERALRSLSGTCECSDKTLCQLKWQESFEGEYQRAYHKALVARLVLSYHRAGAPLDPDLAMTTTDVSARTSSLMPKFLFHQRKLRNKRVYELFQETEKIGGGAVGTGRRCPWNE
jgi:hypothetical protein